MSIAEFTILLDGAHRPEYIALHSGEIHTRFNPLGPWTLLEESLRVKGLVLVTISSQHVSELPYSLICIHCPVGSADFLCRKSLSGYIPVLRSRHFLGGSGSPGAGSDQIGSAPGKKRRLQPHTLNIFHFDNSLSKSFLDQIYRYKLLLKGQCHKIFWHFFIS